MELILSLSLETGHSAPGPSRRLTLFSVPAGASDAFLKALLSIRNRRRGAKAVECGEAAIREEVRRAHVVVSSCKLSPTTSFKPKKNVRLRLNCHTFVTLAVRDGFILRILVEIVAGNSLGNVTWNRQR